MPKRGKTYREHSIPNVTLKKSLEFIDFVGIKIAFEHYYLIFLCGCPSVLNSVIRALLYTHVFSVVRLDQRETSLHLKYASLPGWVLLEVR